MGTKTRAGRGIAVGLGLPQGPQSNEYLCSIHVLGVKRAWNIPVSRLGNEWDRLEIPYEKFLVSLPHRATAYLDSESPIAPGVDLVTGEPS